MTALPGFIGSYGTLRSSNVNVEDCVNLIPYSVSGTLETPKVGAYLQVRPGFFLFVTIEAPVRGLFYQDGLAFAVGGTQFYQINDGGTATAIGTVASDSRHATFASSGSSGNELVICSGGSLYLYNTQTNAFSTVTIDFVAQTVDYIDGRFVALVANSNKFRYSDLLDGSSWPALNVAEREQVSDNIVNLKVVHNQIWLVGSKTSDVWTDVGGQQVFAPIPGAIAQHGSAAEQAFCVLDNLPYWMEQNDYGSALVIRAAGVGPDPQIVSTPAINAWLARASIVQRSQAVAFSMQFDGHFLYVLYVPGLDRSAVYDARENDWAFWTHWQPDTNTDIPYLGTSHMFAFGKHLVGSRLTGRIYEVDFQYPFDCI